METGLYLYCFAPAELAAAPEGTGVDGRSPILVRRWAIAAAVVSEVPLGEFCGAEAESQLEDLAWLGPRACRHQQIVEEVMRQGPVLPARFGAIFSSQARLEEFVERQAPKIAEFLAWVKGREEWGVKGVLDRARARQAAEAEQAAARRVELGELSPGRRHLEEQKLRAAAAKGLQRWVQGVGRGVAADLRGLALASVERRIVGDGGAETVFNWAFLVAREQSAGFRAQVERAHGACMDKGLAFAVSGPWPPYSFVPSLSMEDPA